jgi:integrase/recombinase XerD
VTWLAASHYSPSTVRARKRDLVHFVAWCGAAGLVDAAAVDAAALERYRCALFLSRKRDGSPLGLGSQIQKLLAVKQFLKWATRLRLAPADVGAAFVLPRRPQQLPHAVLNEAEVERVLRQPDVRDPIGLRDRAILETFYSTGIRRMEAINLRAADLDEDRGVLVVRLGKGRKDRVVPIGVRALAWISRYLEHGRPACVRIPDPGNLFLTRRGRPLRNNRLTEMAHRHVMDSGVGKRGSCHIFRHTMATLMLEGGADIRHLQAILGHAHLTTTELYTRVSIAHLKLVHDRTHPAQRGVAPVGGAMQRENGAAEPA